MFIKKLIAMSKLEEIRALIRLQSDTLQAQIVALYADLQATKGLIQAERNGDGGETASPILHSMKLDDGFLESVQNCFGSCKYEHPQGAISNLLNKGTVAQHQSEFEKLMNRVTDVSEGLLISFYISGLKPAIQQELLVSKPTSLGDAFSLARVTKEQLDDQVTLTTSSRLVSSSQFQTLKPMTPRGTMSRPEEPKTPLISASPKHPLGVLVLSNYGERLVGTMHVLIDNGNTHNFIRPDVVVKYVCPYNQPSLSKCISGVGKHCCVRVFSHGSSMQGLTMEVDIYMLPMKGPDVVFGIQWLQKFGKVTHDCAQQTIEFSLANATYNLKGDESLRMKRISLHHMQALLEADDVYGVYKVYSFSMVTEGIITSSEVTESTSPEIEQLLDRFIKVRPYRYPYYQKSEMEKLVKGMMEQGIIRFSQSSFSSPVLLVKKKDGSYRFYVDCWALNEVMIKDKFPIPTTDKMFDELGGANIFTKLDLHAGYHQTRVHERDVYKTAFHTHNGNYEFLVMPFGLTNAPSTFQATMNRLFSLYLCKFMIVFFDENKAFQDLKARLSEAPILGLLNFEDMFIVKVDASDVGIGAVIQTPLQQKYMRKLMGFDFSIEYKTGATNLVADALSRVYDEADDVITEFMALSQPLVSLVNDLRKENETLDELKVIHQKLGRKEALDGFWHEHGMILFRDRYFIGAESKLKELLLSEFHNTSMVRHSGVKKMLTKYSMQAPLGLLQPLPTPSGVWEEVSMDFITGLPPASFNAPKVADVLMIMVVKHHVIPMTIVSDRDPIFVSKF
nr:retrotransposable element Tf2 [Tanacetum cinerariifolium]